MPSCIKPAVIVELKYDRSVRSAISQIREKQYPQALEGYSGEIVLVGVNYDKDSKEHSCVIDKKIGDKAPCPYPVRKWAGSFAGQGILCSFLCLIHTTGRCRFCQATVMDHSFVETEAAGKVVGVIAVSGHDPAGEIAAQPALSDDVYRLMRIDLRKTFPQFIYRNVVKSFDVATGILLCGSDIQQRYAAIRWQRGQLFQMELLQQAVGYIFDHESGHVYRIFGGRVRRRVGQIQIFEPGCC